MVRAILAAIAGYLGIGVLVVFTDQLFSVAIAGMNSMAAPPRSYFLISLVTDFFYSFLGGYLCAALAKHEARRATMILLVGGELIGVIAMFALWHTVPHWFALALLVLFPAAVSAGSHFRRRGEPSAASI
jgi:hypothetical protein